MGRIAEVRNSNNEIMNQYYYDKLGRLVRENNRKLDKSFVITYDLNGGNGTIESQIKAHDETLTLSSVIPTREGYEFLGWATSASGDVEYIDQDSVKNLTSTNGGTINLYAKWKPLSQMFIWDNGKWHRALRYVYDTSS